MHADRRTPVVLLAVLYTVSGVFCLAAGVWPLHPDSPVALNIGVGILALTSGTAFWVLGVRTRWWAVHATIALGGVLIGLLAWRSVTPGRIRRYGPGPDRPRALRRALLPAGSGPVACPGIGHPRFRGRDRRRTGGLHRALGGAGRGDPGADRGPGPARAETAHGGDHRPAHRGGQPPGLGGRGPAQPGACPPDGRTAELRDPRP